MRNLKEFILENTISYKDSSIEKFDIKSIRNMITILNKEINKGNIPKEKLLPIASYIITAIYEPKLKEWLQNSWYGDISISNNNDKVAITSILSLLNSKPQNNNIMKDIVISDISLPNLESNKSNIYTILENYTQFNKSFSRTFLEEFSNIKPGKGTTSEGQYEILLQTFFNNIKRPGKGISGDCLLDGNTLEVKGFNARVGGEDKGMNGISKMRDILIKKGGKYNIDQFNKLFNDYNLFVKPPNDIDKETKIVKVDNSKMIENQIDYLSDIDNSTLTQMFIDFYSTISGFSVTGKDVRQLCSFIKTKNKNNVITEYKLLLAACNLVKYSEKFSGGSIIFINNITSNYIMISANELNSISNTRKFYENNNFNITGMTTKVNNTKDRDNYSPCITYIG